MNLLIKLRQNDGQFDIDDYIHNEDAYVRAIKTLLKNKDYPLLFKVLSCYVDGYKSYASYPMSYYQPGMDFVISCYPMFLYARFMEKGIKGVVEPNKEESTKAYMELLKRIDMVPTYLSSYLYKNKIHLLLKYAYPDLMDRYSVALYHVGMHYYNLKDYRKAFKFFKKGADFDDSGRQIVYPYYLMSKNQSMVADMYVKGLGVKENEAEAVKYYKLSAINCGKNEHQRMGDIYLKRKKYSKAFMAYTEINKNWPWKYSTYFMCPDRLDSKFKKIYKNLDKKEHRTEKDTIVLAMMLKMGLGCEKNIDRAKELLPKEPEWVTKWVEMYVYTRL